MAVIVEGAARILELNGFEGFNTNAVAEKAGVSIGSLYQYFPSKSALLVALVEREAAPLLAMERELANIESSHAAIRCYIQAGVRNQLRRPQLARLIDIAEKDDMFRDQVKGTLCHLEHVVEKILLLPDAPKIKDRVLAAADVVSLTRSLIDAAGERRDLECSDLIRRVEGAVWGYLAASQSCASEPCVES